MIAAFLKDVRYAVRMLLKERAMTLVAIITLSLGISAPVAFFSFLDKVVLKPLPFETLDLLVALHERDPQRGAERKTVSVGDFINLKEQNRSYDALTAYEETEFYLTGATEPERVEGVLVSPDFFQTLGASPAMGRTFLAEEGQPGHERVLVLSHRLWQQSFGSDLNILGKGVLVNGKEHTVVGVMPADYDYPLASSAWAPLALTDQDTTKRTDRYLTVIGRLKPDANVAQAQADTDILMKRIEEQHPQTNLGRRARVVPLKVHVRGDFASGFNAMVLALSFLVLGICCVNIATLQLARAWVRQKEFSLRAALGASRWKIMRQLLTESVLLSLLGCGPAILIAYLSIAVIKNRVPPEMAKNIYGWYSIAVDERVLVFALVTTVVSGIIFGLIPAIQASRVNLNQVLKEDGRSGMGRNRLLRGLLVAEIALAVVALAGTISLLEGFLKLPNKFLGLDPNNVLTMEVSATKWDEDQNYQAINTYQSLFERIGGLNGVESVTATTGLPGSQFRSGGRFTIKGQANTLDLRQTCLLQIISPDFFKTFRIRVLSGREFGQEDNEQSRRVAIISQSLARRYFQNANPIGQEIRIGAATSNEPWLSVVGVVSDVNDFWFDREPRPTVYMPFRQNPKRTTNLAIRTTGDPMQVVTGVVNEIRNTDKNLAISQIKPLKQVISDQLSAVRAAADAAGFCAFISLLLAVTGVYGMAAFHVTQRTREIGVRMALGAQQSDVLTMIIKHVLKLVAIGVGVGLPLSLALSISMSSLLWGVGAFQPITFTGQVLLLIIVGILSSYIPAKRASAVEPVNALRYE